MEKKLTILNKHLTFNELKLYIIIQTVVVEERLQSDRQLDTKLSNTLKDTVTRGENTNKNTPKIKADISSVTN